MQGLGDKAEKEKNRRRERKGAEKIEKRGSEKEKKRERKGTWKRRQ